MTQRRWDTDERGVGVGNARAVMPATIDRIRWVVGDIALNHSTLADMRCLLFYAGEGFA
jgi:hypothetical protein